MRMYILIVVAFTLSFSVYARKKAVSCVAYCVGSVNPVVFLKGKLEGKNEIGVYIGEDGETFGAAFLKLKKNCDELRGTLSTALTDSIESQATIHNSCRENPK